MQINHNISALIANGHLRTTNKALDKSMERLSSGYRINKAADDAAGMAISQKMKTQIAGLEQAARNAADGVSVIQTAEGALAEVEAMAQRMRELSVQAANGTYTAEDREAIQKEVNQLNEEIQRISDDTEFNTKMLLDGGIDRKSYSNNIDVQLISLSDEVASTSYDVTVTASGTKATMEGAALAMADAITEEQEGALNINGEEVVINEGDTQEEVMEKIREVCDRVDVELTVTDSNSMTLTSKIAGSKRSVYITTDNPELATALGLSALIDTTVYGTDAEVELTDGFTTTTTALADGNIVTITDADGFEMKLEVLKEDGSAVGAAGITVLQAGPMVLQIGANEGQTVEVSIPEVSPKTLGIENVNLRTEAGASEAITLLDNAIEQISGIRAKLGAYQNRLEHAIANLDVSCENLTQALSRVEDVDMAEEMTNYTQKSVLSQAGVSMLSQANERPQNILSLLQ